MIMKRQRKSLAAATVRVFLWCLVFSKNKNRFSGNEETGKKQIKRENVTETNDTHHLLRIFGCHKWEHLTCVEHCENAIV